MGLPSAAELTEWIADLHVAVADIIRAPSQEWGVEQFTGRDPAGKAIELSVYGQDASHARCWPNCGVLPSTGIRDPLSSWPACIRSMHEAYLTLMAERAGILAPDVLAAGRFGPSNDAALVTRCPLALPWHKPTPPTSPTAR